MKKFVILWLFFVNAKTIKGTAPFSCMSFAGFKWTQSKLVHSRSNARSNAMRNERMWQLYISRTQYGGGVRMSLSSDASPKWGGMRTGTMWRWSLCLGWFDRKLWLSELPYSLPQPDLYQLAGNQRLYFAKHKTSYTCMYWILIKHSEHFWSLHPNYLSAKSLG